MFLFEWLTIAYLSGLLAAALLGATLRATAIAMGLGTLAMVAMAPFAPPDVRFWMPVGYLLVGYRLPGFLVRADARPMQRFEEWLARTDLRVLRWLPGLPAPVAPVVEVAYLFCYPLVPASFALAWSAGTPLEFERFWVSVLLSGYLCYGTLPWLLTRPPRVMPPSWWAGFSPSETPAAVHPARRLNVFVLSRFSHGWNTFPSGHVAVSWAAAWSLLHIWPAAGVAVAVLASAISIGAATGGYHYAIDVVAGWLIAGAVAVITW